MTTTQFGPARHRRQLHELDCGRRGRFRVVAEGFAGSIFAHILPTLFRETNGIRGNSRE